MKKTTIFQLLKDGCEIKFPSGYIISGDPANGYIDTFFELDGHKCGDGVRELNENGVRLAIADAKQFEQHSINAHE